MTYIVYSPAVAAAIAAGRPVVALESTIITHGMPWPRNVETARLVEDAVREEGGEPATIVVLDGIIHAGLDAGTLERVGRADGFLKLSRADLGYAVAAGRSGSTTVAATMIAADRAGIPVFATGGIGGVHRGAERTFDVSADLQELARTPVCVVCAGAKAILDLPKTLEALETLGVPVVGYRTDEFPAFWSRSSGLAAPMRLDRPEDDRRTLQGSPRATPRWRHPRRQPDPRRERDRRDRDRSGHRRGDRRGRRSRRLGKGADAVPPVEDVLELTRGPKPRGEHRARASRMQGWRRGSPRRCRRTGGGRGAERGRGVRVCAEMS